MVRRSKGRFTRGAPGPVRDAFMMVAILGLGAVQLFGIVGEYVGEIYSETLRRPLYVIAESAGVAVKD